MSYRERSIYSHRASVPSTSAPSKPAKMLDQRTGDGTTARGRKKPAPRDRERDADRDRDRDRDRRRAVTAATCRESGKSRKAVPLEAKKKLKGKKSSKSSTQLKREALEQPELQEIYVGQEVHIPASPPARVNPYHKYQQLIDELNRKYEHEQSLDKIYHRHIEFSVDMGDEERQRRPRQGGALTRTDAVTTSTLADVDIEGVSPVQGQSVVELRYADDEGQATETADHDALYDVHTATTLLGGEALDSVCSDGSGECDSSDPDDAMATFEAAARGAFDPYQTVAFDDFDAFARTSMGSGGGDELDLDTGRTSVTTIDMDCTLATSSEAFDKSGDGDAVDDSDSEREEDDVEEADDGTRGSTQDSREDDADAASGGYSLAGSEEADASDSEQGEYSLDDDEGDGDGAVDTGSDSEDAVVTDGAHVEAAVSVGGGDSEDADDDDGEGGDAVVCDEKDEDRDERTSTGNASASASVADGDTSDAERRDAKSTTSLPSSVLTSSPSGVVGPARAEPGPGGQVSCQPLLVGAEGGRCEALVDGHVGGSYLRAQQQIAALQAQVATLRAGKIEEAHRRVRLATWLRHVTYVDSRLRAELLKVGDLWRRLQPLAQIARHWSEDARDAPLADDGARHWPAVASGRDAYPTAAVEM